MSQTPNSGLAYMLFLIDQADAESAKEDILYDPWVM